jgi:dTDP-glucose 4,6-dehydratase
MRILVAGGAGFVGSHLCRALVARGDRVVCVDDLSSGSRANVADLEGDSRLRLVVHDVSLALPWSVTPWVDPTDVVIHLASPASPVDYAAHPVATLVANSTGTGHLLDLAAYEGARFVYVSTSEVYGDPLVHPQPESYWGNVDPIGPRSMYDEGKRFGEALVTAYRHEGSMKAAIVRPFNTYGPGMRHDDGRVVTSFIDAALRGEPIPIHGDGHQTRSFQYVDDLVDGLLHVIDDPDLDGLVANIGNPDEVTMLELGLEVLDATRSSSHLELVAGRVGDPQRRCPVIDVMRARYGWSPKVELRDGLARTVRWFRDQPS